MREEDKLMTEQGQVLEKKSYNLRERKIKDAPYRNMIRAELADELYDRIMNIIVLQKKYKDPNYSAKDLAKELKNQYSLLVGCHQFPLRNELFMPGKRVPNQGRFAYVDRQALCGKECRRNQYNGRFCQPSVVLCGFL